jgi:hypothetical protein
MSSTAQTAANQANAKFSTGPRTVAGKAASSQNHVKLGLACRTFAVRGWESQEDFDAYANALIADYQPVNTIESTLVLKIAQHHWCSQRAFMSQGMCFNDDCALAIVTTPDSRHEMALYLRYQADHDRAFHKCRQELDKIQAARKNEPAKQEFSEVRLAITKMKCERDQQRTEKLRPTAVPEIAVPVVEIPAPVAVPMPVAA